MSKDSSQPIKELWNEWLDSYCGNERYLPLFGLIDLQRQDMETNCGTNIINIEPEFTFLEGLCPVITIKTGVLEQIRFFKIKVSCSTGRSKGNC